MPTPSFRRLLQPFQVLYALYALLVFVALMIPVFLFAVLASTAGALRGGNLVYRACCVWGDLWFPLVAIFHRNLYEQPLRKGQPYIFVANHISYLDTPVLVKTFRQPLRPLGKAEMGRIPVFGFIYRRAIVSVDRSSNESKARSMQRLMAILRHGVSVLVFPEGTFNETGRPLKSFYDGAFRIAIETGTPIKPVLILDTYRRMHYRSVFSLNPGRSRSVFLEEVPVEGYTLRDVRRLKEKVFALMEEKLRQYQAPWIDRQAAVQQELLD